MIRSTQRSRSAVTRSFRLVRREASISPPSSSRVTVEAEATIDRSSRSGVSLPVLRATEARSFQVARPMIGRSSSAMAIRGASVTSGRPSARARAFCSWMAWRTDGTPPLMSCSATGSCSGRRSASAALR